MTKGKNKREAPAFEDSIRQLEDIITRLEDPDTNLETSLADFEQGIKLVREAQAVLQEAEQKVSLLTERDGEPLEQPFHEDDAE